MFYFHCLNNNKCRANTFQCFLKPENKCIYILYEYLTFFYVDTIKKLLFIYKIFISGQSGIMIQETF